MAYKHLVLLLIAASAIAFAQSTEESPSLSQQLADLERKIRANEAKLRAIEGVKLYSEKNKLVKLQSGHVEELAQLFQKHQAIIALNKAESTVKP